MRAHILAPAPTGASAHEEPDQPGPTIAAPAGLPMGLSLPWQVAALAVWPFLEQVLAFMVVFVDVMVAGWWLTKADMNAVGVAMYIGWLMNILIGAAGIGATALVARAAGAGRRRRAESFLGQALVLGLAWALSVMALLYLAAPRIAGLSGLGAKEQDLAVSYLRLMALAAPAMTATGVANACLRGSGDTRTPFLIMLAVNWLNAGACLLLVWPGSPAGGWGIAGLGMAMVIAWSAGAVIVTGALLFNRRFPDAARSGLKLRRRFLVPRRPAMWRIARLGLPSLAEGFGMWLANFAVMLMVGRFIGGDALGVHTVTVRLEALSYLPGFALGIAASTMVGQYLGAKDPRTARRAAWWCWVYGAGMMTFAGLLFALRPEFFVSLVTDKAEYLERAPVLLRMAGLAQLGFATAIVFGAAHRGAGDTRTALYITYGSTFLVRLPLVYLLAVWWGLGLWGVWAGLCLELMFRGAVFLASFLRGRWARVKV